MWENRGEENGKDDQKLNAEKTDSEGEHEEVRRRRRVEEERKERSSCSGFCSLSFSLSVGVFLFFISTKSLTHMKANTNTHPE